MPLIQKVRFTHDAVIDEIMLRPAVSQGELARMFGYTEAWLSIIINSDAFKFRLAERKAEIVDPVIKATIEERLRAVAERSLDRIMERLDGPSAGAIKNADLAAFAKVGLGNRFDKVPAPIQSTNNLYVVNLPPPAQSTEKWLESSSRFAKNTVIENG
jgi:hypothetical protein